MAARTPSPGPADQPSLRRANLSRVLRHLREHAPCSRAAVATSTGLHKATVSTLVDELLSRRLVRETGLEHSGQAGRPGRMLAVDGSGVGGLGVEIDVDHLAVHATDLAGRPLVERRIGFDTAGAGPEGCLAALGDVIRDGIGEMALRGAAPVGIGVAVPGLVDAGTGTVILAPNLGWRDLPLRDRLSRHIGAPLRVEIDNDANLAGLAEHTQGVAAGTPHLVHLTGGVGVGGGIIVGGRLLRGADGFAGEVGHLPVDPGGRRCGCGRTGCWETRVGLAELLRLAAPGSTSVPIEDPEERALDVARRVAAGDPAATGAVGEIGRWLGLGAAILVDLVNPRAIVLGGYFATLADHLLPAARLELDRRAVAGPAARCRLLASDLGFTAAARGAAGMVVDRVFADPTSVGVPAAGAGASTATTVAGASPATTGAGSARRVGHVPPHRHVHPRQGNRECNP